MTDSPLSVVQQWFAAHAAGDLDRARRLLAPSAPIVVGTDRLVGFDAFMEWYRDRVAAEGPAFSYDVIELLGGERHAVALLRLSRGDGAEWQQVAVYEVDGGVIRTVTAYEGARSPRSTSA